MHALDLARQAELMAKNSQPRRKSGSASSTPSRRSSASASSSSARAPTSPGRPRASTSSSTPSWPPSSPPGAGGAPGDDPGDSATAVRVAYETLARKGCEPVGVIVNRVPPAVAAEDAARVAPRDEDELASSCPRTGSWPARRWPRSPRRSTPTSWRRAGAPRPRGARHDGGGDSAEHFIEDLVDGTLVIVPGDRPDIVIASLACTLSPNFPAIAGIVLTSGYAVAPAVGRLLEDTPFAVLQVAAGTYATATAVHAVRPVITAADDPEVATAIGVFEAGVDTAALRQRIALARSRWRTKITAVVFKYELIEGERWAPRRIVLPEGEAACQAGFNPFDLTKVWPHGDYTLIKVDAVGLNQYLADFHTEMEQAAFEPNNLVPGISLRPTGCCSRVASASRRAPGATRGQATSRSLSTRRWPGSTPYSKDGGDGVNVQDAHGVRAEPVRRAAGGPVGDRPGGSVGDERRDGPRGLQIPHRG